MPAYFGRVRQILLAGILAVAYHGPMLTKPERRRFAAAFIALGVLTAGSIFLSPTKADPLDDFVAAVAAETMNLKIGDSVVVAFPKLLDNQLLIVFEAPYRGQIEDRRGLSDKTMGRMLDEQAFDGANRTILSVTQDGNIRYQQFVYGCHLNAIPSTGLRISPTHAFIRARCESPDARCHSLKKELRWNQGCTIVLSVQ